MSRRASAKTIRARRDNAVITSWRSFSTASSQGHLDRDGHLAEDVLALPGQDPEQRAAETRVEYPAVVRMRGEFRVAGVLRDARIDTVLAVRKANGEGELDHVPLRSLDAIDAYALVVAHELQYL